MANFATPNGIAAIGSRLGVLEAELAVADADVVAAVRHSVENALEVETGELVAAVLFAIDGHARRRLRSLSDAANDVTAT